MTGRAPWRAGLLGRRARGQAAVLWAVALVMLVATTLLGTFALLLDDASHDALDAALGRADEDDLRITVDVWVAGAPADPAVAAAQHVVDTFTDGLATDRGTWLTGVLHTLSGRAEGGAAPLVYAADYPDAAQRTRLVAGAWPDRARDDDGRLLVAVPASAASRYGWEVGTEVPVGAQRGGAPDTWVVTGTHESTEPGRPWTRDALDGREHDPSYPVPGAMGMLSTDAWGPAVVAPGALGGAGATSYAQLVVVPRLADAPRGAVTHLRAAVADAQLSLSRGLEGTGTSGRVSTTVGRTVDAAWRELAVTRVAVMVTGLLLVVLATNVVLLAARLLGQRRAAESELLAARGARPGQLRSLAGLEAGVLALGTAVLAPWGAIGLYTAVVARGPLTAAGYTAPARPTALVVVTCVVVAGVLAAALVVPQWHVRGSSRRGARGGLVRTAAELVLVGLAGVALWQLVAHGAVLGAGPDGPRVDPVLVAAPAVVALGAAVVAVRLVRPLASVADGVAQRRRSLVGPLAAWQVARRPATAAGTAMLVVLAVACATFAHAYQVTWRTSQLEQVDLATGTDVRVDALTGDAGASRTVADVLASHPDVVAQPVVVREVGVGRRAALTGAVSTSGQRTGLVAVDTSRGETLRGRTGTPWSDLLRPLGPTSAARPVPLPGDPGRLELVVTPVLEHPVDGTGVVSVVLQDDHGVRVTLLASVPTLAEPTDLALDVPPMAQPVGVAAVTARLSGHPESDTRGPSRLGVAFSSLRVVDRADLEAETPGARDVPLSGAPWTATLGSDGRTRAIDVDAGDQGAVVATTLTDPASLATEPVLVALTTWERATAVPAIVSQGLAARADVVRGGHLVVRFGTSEIGLTVAEVVPHVPGTPRGDGVLVDLDLLGRAVAATGGFDRLVDSWWFGAAAPDDGRALADDLGRAAVGDVTVRADERESAVDGPLRVAVPVALWFLLGAAVLLVVVGLGTACTLTVRARRLELARLHAIGASHRSLVGGLVAETGFLVGLGAVVGGLVGHVLARVVTPVAMVSADGRAPVPAPVLVWGWQTQGGVAGGLVVLGCLTAALTAALLVRQASGELLRLGDDR